MQGLVHLLPGLLGCLLEIGRAAVALSGRGGTLMLRTCCRKAEESGVKGEIRGRGSAREAECGTEPIFCDNYIEE